MLLKGFFYALHRIHQLGLQGLYNTARRRLRSKLWRLRMRNNALAGTANHTWTTIVQKNQAPFEIFFTNVKRDLSIQRILCNDFFIRHMPPQDLLLQKAQNAHNRIFDLLGSGPVRLPSTINWHHEFKKDFLREPFTKTDTSFSYSNYTRTFHADIPVPQYGNDLATYHEDIKVLWDLGRMHHLSALGMAAHILRDATKAAPRDERGIVLSNFMKNIHDSTHPEQAPLITAHPEEADTAVSKDMSDVFNYTTTFVHDITSFQDQVSYLLGPHWKCPMDVAIRAINLIWALHLFKDEEAIPLDFWQRYVCMLYDHMIYLSWNFEESDRPNNHLLTDYVGYLYLAALFHDLPGGAQRLTWIKKTLQAAFEQQILPDGTAYEGSTAYHRLDCELLLHTTSLLRALETPTPPTCHPGRDPGSNPQAALETLLNKMLAFLTDVTDHGGNLITIGDDDSGCIVFGLLGLDPRLRGEDRVENTHDIKESNPQKHLLVKNVIPAKAGTQSYQHDTSPHITLYQNFGLGIIRTKNIHLTLRTQRQQTSQPSGHFHHDALNITLNIDGHPLFVDCGSFVYTANAQWRAFFKAAHNHSTFHVGEIDTTQPTRELDPRLRGEDHTEKRLINKKYFSQKNHLPENVIPAKAGTQSYQGISTITIDLFQTTPRYEAGTLTATENGLHATAQQKNGALLERTVSITTNSIALHDSVLLPTPNTATWRFILHPSVTAHQSSNGFVLHSTNHEIVNLESTLILTLKHDAAFASGYGHFQRTTALEAIEHVSTQTITHTTKITHGTDQELC